MPMMLRFSMTAIVSRMTCSSLVAAGSGRGITANGVHIGGYLAVPAAATSVHCPKATPEVYVPTLQCD